MLPYCSIRVKLYLSNIVRFFIFSPRHILIIKKCSDTQACTFFGGVKGDRTPDLRIANATLSHLRYDPNTIGYRHINPFFIFCQYQFNKQNLISDRCQQHAGRYQPPPPPPPPPPPEQPPPEEPPRRLDGLVAERERLLNILLLKLV